MSLPDFWTINSIKQLLDSPFLPSSKWKFRQPEGRWGIFPPRWDHPPTEESYETNGKNEQTPVMSCHQNATWEWCMACSSAQTVRVFHRIFVVWRVSSTSQEQQSNVAWNILGYFIGILVTPIKLGSNNPLFTANKHCMGFGHCSNVIFSKFDVSGCLVGWSEKIKPWLVWVVK